MEPQNQTESQVQGEDAGRTTEGRPQVPVDDARRTTDASLLAERDEADRALREKLAKGERETDRAVEETHGQVTEKVAEVKEQALHEARTTPKTQAELGKVVQRHQAALADAGEAGPGRRTAEQALEQTKKVAERAVVEEMSKGQEVVARVADRAEQALEEELQRFQELTGQEREQRKRDFLELLSSEREKTDRALDVERGSSDFQVRSRDEMLGVISHDLRNYLTVVGMKADMLRKAAPGGDADALRARAEDIGNACKTMARWANDLVDLSSIETGGVRLEMRVHDPSALVERSVQAFTPMAAKKNARVTVQVPDDRPKVLCDADRLAQVLNNLLDNALKFMDKPGKVLVRAEAREPGFVTVSVQDDGPGIPEEERPRVFERAWHAEKGRAGGTGLGLHISQKIVEAMGGRIWFESEVGKGTTFFFTVPRAPAGMT